MESAAVMMAPMMLSYMMTSVAPVALLMQGDFPKERIARGAAQLMIMGARAAADVTYGDLILDERSGDFSIRDLRIELPESSGLEDCVIEIASITIVSLDRHDALAFSNEGEGLTVSPTCAGPEGAIATQMLGPEVFNADHFSATHVYTLGTSTVDTTILLETAAAGSVSFSGQVEGLHLQQPAYGGDPMPAGRITNVSLTVQDIDTLRQLIPMLGVEGDPVEMVAGTLQGMLARDGFTNDETALIDSAKAELGRIMKDGGSITLRSAPGVAVSFAELEQTGGPEDLVPLLKPRFSSAIIGPEVLVTADRLKTALSSPDDLDPAQRLEVAEALATGIGAPRSVPLAASLLEPMAASGNAEAALAYARLLDDDNADPNTAYRHALTAAAGGADGAWSVLDRIEAGLPLEAVLDLQDAVGGDATEPSSDVGALRAAARDLATGRGVARNYRSAVYLALLASAAGDRSSALLLERLARRFENEDDEAAWKALEAQQSEKALLLWGGGFANEFAAQ